MNNSVSGKSAGSGFQAQIKWQILSQPADYREVMKLSCWWDRLLGDEVTSRYHLPASKERSLSSFILERGQATIFLLDDRSFA